jgi:hypothetical protein
VELIKKHKRKIGMKKKLAVGVCIVMIMGGVANVATARAENHIVHHIVQMAKIIKKDFQMAQIIKKNFRYEFLRRIKIKVLECKEKGKDVTGIIEMIEKRQRAYGFLENQEENDKGTFINIKNI